MKDATRYFHKHELPLTHKAAVEYMVTLPATTNDIGDLLSSNYAGQKQANREYLVKIIQNVRFLARQGLALRGDGDEKDSASSLHRIKTYLHSTMSQQKLNNLMILHTHKERTDKLNLTQCLKDFTLSSDHRTDLLG